jgi:hypothetical protein
VIATHAQTRPSSNSIFERHVVYWWLGPVSGQPTEALSLGETALTTHDKVLGSDHTWTKDSARVTADALDALGSAEEAKALRERYGGPESPEPLSAST